ncbi:MAG TPA: hypothetical protein DEA44_12300 [Firmicutes bacterium]|nr:hypothetical protein [Bacillota bacterium]HWR56796.1 type 4a pilus biogenesis protein PilO [Negativicutes bacterium]
MKLSFPPLSAMSPRDRMLLAGWGTIVFILGFYFLISKPRAASLEILQGRLQQQRLALLNAQQALREMADPDEYYRQLREEDIRVRTLLPDNEGIADLLVSLNNLSKGQNVWIGSIKQGAFVDRKTYYEIPLEITVTGTYPDLIKFINKLEHGPRFNSLTKMAVRGEDYLLTMQLAMVVYVYGPLPPQAQAKSK